MDATVDESAAPQPARVGAAEEAQGRIHFVTGAASGIGRHLVERIVARGGYVVAADIDEEALAVHADQGHWSDERVQRIRLDVRDLADWELAVERAIERWGRIDVLINSAGISVAQRIDQADPDTMDRHIDINLKGVIYGCHIVSKRMHAQRSGHIVNIASLAALVPLPGMSLYAASKFGVRGFSHAIAEDLEDDNIHVTTVCPDAVATPMLDFEATQPDAAISFSGGAILTVEAVGDAVMNRVLARRPREVLVTGPLALLTRAIAAWPGLLRYLIPTFMKRGRRNQRRYLESIQKRSKP